MMPRNAVLATLLFLLGCVGSLCASPLTGHSVHYLGDAYHFDKGHGWESRNVSRGNYLSQRRDTNLVARAGRHPVETHNKDSEIVKGLLAGIGDFARVITTWYTGNDLKNPSCWQETRWTPTDDSHICAVTLEGWASKPKCFDFLELCNRGKKCIFVRVVDTCAGCARGSHHIDLTKGAFSHLADPDTGILNDIMCRPATRPKKWITKLWGPRD